MAKKSKSQDKVNVRRYAPIGLWVSGAGLFSFIIILVIKLLIFIGLYALTDQKTVNLILWISLGVAVVGLAVFALFDPQKVREFISGRQARHGSNAVIMLVAFILILVVVNAIVYQNPVQWDWTEGKQNTLAPETIDTLNALPSAVHAIAFFTPQSSTTSTQDLFNKVKAKSNGKFSYEFVDPVSNPAKAQQYKITQDASVVLVMDGRQEVLTSPTEQDFDNALVHLMNPGQRTVYFLTGHGERDISTAGNDSMTRAKTVLESKNYTVNTLNLLAENSIPTDALSIIIAGPTKPISSSEMTLLKAYVDKGGSLVVMEDASLDTTASKTADPLIDYLTSSWGITLNNDIVIDPSSSQALVAIENSYGTHPITSKLQSQNMVTFFPTARSLTLDENIANVKTTGLVLTIDRSWGETDFAALQNNQASFDSSTDIPGPLTIAAAGTNSATNGKLVVIGDSIFASDLYFDQYGNGSLFINSIDWAAGQGNMISLTSAQPINRQMRLPNNLTVPLLAFAFVILIPGLIVVAGIVTWVKRRSRG